MKILIVASNNAGCFSLIIMEQVNSLCEHGITIDYFGIEGKGFVGYIKNRKRLIKKIEEFQPDIVHAHYGLSGLLANMQRSVPVITTFHGSDVHQLGLSLMLSRICMKLSRHNIFVSERLYNIASYAGNNYSILPCGIDINTFRPSSNIDARKKMGLDIHKRYILFSGPFDRLVKNISLAQKAISNLENTELIELKGYTREQVVNLMNSVDLALMTSHSEGSPQFIKEAMACNCPLVTTDVGDVRWLIGDTDGCYITSYEVEDCADKIKLAIKFSDEKKLTNGRERITQLGLDNSKVAEAIIGIYKTIAHNK